MCHNGSTALVARASDIALFARAFAPTPFRHRTRAEYEARMERLRQELARGADAHTQNISRHRLHIAENILTLKCPRAACRRAFLDYTGCMALYCACGCGFCAWCLHDCGADAHPHVKACPHNLLPTSCVRARASRSVFCDSLSMYWGSREQFEQAHRQRVRPLVLQCVPLSLPSPCFCNIASRYLAGIPQAEQADVRLRRNINTRVCLCDIPRFFRQLFNSVLQVRAAIAPDLRDLKIAL